MQPSSAPNDTSESNRNRARYDDEKKRIIESCFSKIEDGVPAEQYITHVRVVEDSAYPSTAPPPDAAAANKKSRVIMVAVKKNGRVRVHKARENATGTFSIGKSWNLEELSAVLSYASLVPRNNRERLEQQYAGGVGFIVTLGKPYYWMAPTSKEKDFFIGSLVRIYRKYTGGKVPELTGFAPQEVELLTGVRPTAPSSSPQVLNPPPPPIPATSERRSQSPQSFRSQNQGNDPAGPPGRQHSQPRNNQTPPARDAQRPPPIEPLRSPPRNDERQASRDGKTPRPVDSATRPPVPEQTPPPMSHPHPPNIRPPIDSNSVPVIPEQKHIEPVAEKTAVVGASVMESKKPTIMKQEPRFEPKSGVQSESNSQFATPAASPSDLKEEPVPSIATLSQEHLPTPSTQPSRTEHPRQGKSIYSEVTSPVSEAAQEMTTASSAPAIVDDTAAATESMPVSKEPEEEHRPGLGPMFKKKSAKDIAGQFRRAALAAAAFQPRQGGAGARLKALQDKDKFSNEPDGITSVVPAPLLRGMSSDTSKSSAPATPTVATAQEQSMAAAIADNSRKGPIQRSATDDSISMPDTPVQVSTPAAVPATTPSPAPAVSTPAKKKSEADVRPPSPEKARSRSPQRKKKQRQNVEISKYCSALGIDPRTLEGRGADFNDLLTEFGWNGKLAEERRLDDFEADIKREIGRAQATGWLGHVEQQEGKVQDLAKAFDKAIEECEELDGLFTLYSHELDTLAADIEFIEAQSQGLQVQTANQKLLQNELNNLLRTLTIPSSDLRGLQSGSLDSATGVETVEKSLSSLYKALITIDPDIRQNRVRQAVSSQPERNGIGVYADSEIGQMRAVREKKDDYREATMIFVKRFNQHMAAMFKSLDDKTLHDERGKLWKYNVMMLFVREVNSYEWQTMITGYEMNLKGTYQTQFRDFAMENRRMVRKPGAEELEALFTTQEKDKSDETLASSAARKLTVKRGKTIKSSAVRQQLGERRDGKPDAWEVFGTVLRHQSSIVSEEQNFVVHFFHLNSQENADFAELAASRSPDRRALPNLKARQQYDPDRDMAKIVQGVVEGIYTFWPSDLQSLLDWALAANPLQGVGILLALEQNLAFYEETNQEYIIRTVRTLHERLTGLFHKFVDEQIKAIEETKVKVKKRKGVISFMRTFPIFVTAIEHLIPAEASPGEGLEVRFIVNDAYTKILKAMWESLNFIAKDDPAGGAGHSTAPTSGDPEDKEALNYQILLIENMNHYLEEVEAHSNVVLEEWADKARHDFSTHLTQYTDSVIRRPLGKWLDFLESTEAMMKSSESGGIATKPSHSRSTAKKVLSSHDGKEIKKGIETLKKRIEKHFGDIDDPTTMSKALIMRVYEDCNARYASAYDRMKSIIDKVYDGNLEIDWRKEEVSAAFKK